MDTAPAQPPATEAPALSTATRAALAEAVTAVPHTRRHKVPAVSIAPLREYQKEATSLVWRQVKDGGRCIVESACGSGKTLIAASITRHLAAKGRVLVLVPTIELLEQTANSWSNLGGRRGLSVAACSREEALERAEAGGHIDAVVTTDAAQIAHLVAAVPTGQPVTVYATYASLERIVQAHRDFRLPVWDLVVIDEAHRTAGSIEKPWAAVHEDATVPALRRVYCTATPRIADFKPGSPDGLTALVEDSAPTVYSMDDPAVYGPTAFRYSFERSAADGWIADYEVLVPVITDSDLQELLALPAIADLRSQRSNEELQRLALQVAVLRAIADLELRRVITFHSRIPAARAFATSLVETAQILPEWDRPERLWARAVAGSDRLKDRREAFAAFAAHTGEDGEECGIIANARLLAEGIDLPAVDAIVFADPKSSPIDIVQAIGRAVRKKSREEKKTARIIIPVYLPARQPDADFTEEDQARIEAVDPEAARDYEAEIDASAFKSVWRVLHALAAHDSRVVGRITELRTHRSQQPITQAEPGDAEGQAATESEGEESPIEWLRIDAKANSEAILRALKLRTFNPRSQEWERMYALAAAYYAEHGHLDATEGELAAWLSQQRYLKAAGQMAPARESELNAIGMIWDKHAHSWERGFAHSAAFHRQHGHLAIPVGHKSDGYNSGQWQRRQRKNADQLTAEQQARMDALDPLWRLDPDWNRSYRRFEAYLAAGGTLTGPANRPGLGDDPSFNPGMWQRKQAALAAAGKHTPEQTELLKAIGIAAN